MKLDQVKAEILSAATEDWTALWELLSDCRKIMPETTNEELRVIVREAILSLISEGLIALCDQPFPGDAPIEPYTVTDAKKILSDAKNWAWAWPPTGAEYGIVATDLGMDSYFGSREAWDRG